MSESFTYTRRAFAKSSLGAGLFIGLASKQAMAAALATYEPRVLTSAEFAAVKALMSRLIPADEESGGAVEACAYVYLDQALGAYHARHLATYRSALAELDRIARTEQAVAFATLPASRMDELIGKMEKGALVSDKFPDGGAAFFNLIRRHTLEGYLSDPMYGGNKDFMGWRTIGYNGVQLVYSDATQELNGPDDRDAVSVVAFGGSPMK